MRIIINILRITGMIAIPIFCVLIFTDYNRTSFHKITGMVAICSFAAAFILSLFRSVAPFIPFGYIKLKEEEEN